MLGTHHITKNKKNKVIQITQITDN